MAPRHTASLVLIILMLTVSPPAHAQLVPKASPSTPVESNRLEAPADPYPQEDWPRQTLPPAAGAAGLGAKLDAAFADEALAGLSGTRALLIIHHGALVYERYARGVGRETRFPAASPATGLINAGIAMLVGDGKLALDAPGGPWRTGADRRAAITVGQLLTMTSGLAVRQTSNAEMLFGRGHLDMAAFAAARRLAHRPGMVFRDDAGSMMILSSLLVRTIAPAAAGPAAKRAAVRDFFDRRLFAPLGITSAVMEFDAAGNFGAGLHMTAGDTARLSYLFLRGGIWNGQPLLPAGFADLSAPALAGDAGGTTILLAPERALVILRLGPAPDSPPNAIVEFLNEVAAAFPRRETP